MDNQYPQLTAALLAAIAQCMSDDIRDELHTTLAPCAPGEFLTAYIMRDPDFPVSDFDTGNH